MKTVTVIGLGQFGSQLAIGLNQKGFEVIGIDENKEIISEIKDFISQAVILDATDEIAMRAINIENVDVAVVAIGSNMQSSLLTTALLQRMDIRELYVRALNPLQESILKTMGVQKIINIEREMGIQLANALTAEKVARYIEVSDRHSLVETKVPPSLIGKKINELDLRTKHGINIVGIKTRVPSVNDEGEIRYTIKMTDIPEPEYLLGREDLLVIFGTDDNLRKFLQIEQPYES